MPSRVRDESGFTLVELLFGIVLLSISSIGFYTVLFASADSSKKAEQSARVAAEARLGFNRMVRDTREGIEIKNPSAASYTVEVDFDGDGVIEPNPADPTGSYERMIFTFNPGLSGNGTITAGNGTASEVLVRGVDCIRKADNSCHDVFTYRSSRLQYDSNADGVTSAAELDAAATIGNGNGLLDGAEPGAVNSVAFGLRVTVGDNVTNFYSEAQLRNER